MTKLALVSPNQSFGRPTSSQWAHDIRNALATVGLHLETLERISSAGGRTALNAAQALLFKAADLCNDAMDQGIRAEMPAPRRHVDVVKVIRQVTGMLDPIARPHLDIQVTDSGAVFVLADAQDIFRVLFNLMQNAVAAARKRKGRSVLTISSARTSTTVVVTISDDGPGLPATVRARLFRPAMDAAGTNGHGLAIARELAERNGALLELAKSNKGTRFTLELPAAVELQAAEGPVVRLLGHRAVGS